jgi:hypothetical protein
MQPTPEADLRAIRESLERLVAGEEAPPAIAPVLGDTIRSLRRLERSWSTLLPYLAAENNATRTLLAELEPLVPAELRSALHDAAAAAPPTIIDPALLDPGPIHSANADLRELLARVIGALPSGEAGAQARRRIQAHLSETVMQRPW